MEKVRRNKDEKAQKIRSKKYHREIVIEYFLLLTFYFLFLEKEIYFLLAGFFAGAFTGAALTGSAGFSGSAPSMPISSTLKMSIE